MGTQPPASADFVSMDEAVCRVAAAIAAGNGDEWLGPLTARQRKLIAYYVNGSTGQEPASIMPGMITFTRGGWAKYPLDPALTAEVDRALYQQNLYEGQCEGALDWLEGHGFEIRAESISGQALAREMAMDFPSKGPDAAPDVTASRPDHGSDERVAALLAGLPCAREPKPKLIRLPGDEPKTDPSAAAWKALKALYPNDVPSNKKSADIHKQVNQWIKKQPRNIIPVDAVSVDTVKRLLGRRRQIGS